MKAILVVFDSLNRHSLPPYGNDWIKAPNFARLAERAATFDSAYIGSSPTIPTRRELHTGRYNFLHRNWGPLEPFDDSMPEILKRNGVYTHLVTDTHHYWDDGGMTYHERYVYMRAPEGHERAPLYYYTLMFSTNRTRFSVQEMRLAQMVAPLSFTKGCPVLRIPVLSPAPKCDPMKTLLFDLGQSPTQEETLDDPEVERRMIEHLVRLMKENEAPPELYDRLGL